MTIDGFLFLSINDSMHTFRFVQKSNKLTNVKLLQKFGGWRYGHLGFPGNRMPYLGRSGYKRTLLTAAKNNYNKPWGAIIVDQSIARNKVTWLPRIRISGAIWYWLNENDCYSDYRKSKFIPMYDQFVIASHPWSFSRAFLYKRLHEKDIFSS